MTQVNDLTICALESKRPIHIRTDRSRGLILQFHPPNQMRIGVEGDRPNRIYCLIGEGVGVARKSPRSFRKIDIHKNDCPRLNGEIQALKTSGELPYLLTELVELSRRRGRQGPGRPHKEGIPRQAMSRTEIPGSTERTDKIGIGCTLFDNLLDEGSHVRRIEKLIRIYDTYGTVSASTEQKNR